MGKAELALARHRTSQYQWFARRYRDDASEEQYKAEEALRSADPEMERIHRAGTASATRIARFYEKEAEWLEERLARD
ncbi:MAG: hypothetical protein IH993_08270 [Proteobacteria bacterium]|nr:hypothetical protein [Pseudomonadota bacterium]